MNRLESSWYHRSPWLILLTPASLVYCGLGYLRRLLYRAGLLTRHRIPVPVVIVGNLTAGGTGKTPLVTWLVHFLSTSGYRPGVIARGYKGRALHWPQAVRVDSNPLSVGDEAVLLAGRCGCPVVVGPDRVAAARALLERGECDLIVADDGLQHYALDRDIEIVVIDGARRFGNGFCLPAGPLRESTGRLTEVDLVVVNGAGGPGEYPMTMHAESAISLESGIAPRALAGFERQSVHAVAGIGNPGRFFACLRQAGMRLEEHVFPDHHVYVAADLDFGDNRPVVMTEKDAVKCRNFGIRNSWYIPVTIEMPAQFGARVHELLARGGRPAAAVVS
ncbi:MAG: tetraacyldisaccharide 4'-kinase [Gammaproteobacteria bacterium]